MTLRNLSYGNYGIFLVMVNAGFLSSAVFMQPHTLGRRPFPFNSPEALKSNSQDGLG